MLLSAEQKNAQMSIERTTLTKLLSAATKNDFASLRQIVEEYIRQHIDVSVLDVLSQFKDAQKRTALHFACQSIHHHSQRTEPPEHPQANRNNNNDDDDDDIVEQMMDWICSQPPKLEAHLKVQKFLRLKDSEGLTPIMMAAQSYRNNDDNDNTSKKSDSSRHPSSCVCERRIVALIRADQRTTAKSTTTSKNTIHPPTQPPPDPLQLPQSTLGLARSKVGATALHYAAAHGASKNVMDLLITSGRIAIHTFSNTGGTPLHWVCSNVPPKNYVTTIQALLDHGADFNAYNEHIPPSLTVAMVTGNDCHASYILSQMLQPQPQPHPQLGEEKEGEVTTTSKEQYRDLKPSIDYILQPGNTTTLQMAADMNLLGTLSLLVDFYSSSPSTYDAYTQTIFGRTNDSGYTALDLAAKEKHIDCVLKLHNSIRGSDGDEWNMSDAETFATNWKPSSENGAANVSQPTVNNEPDEVKSNIEDPMEQKAKLDASRILSERSNSHDETSQDTDDNNNNNNTSTTAQEHKALGNAYFTKMEWTKAMEEYTAAIAIQPDDATYYSNRSACYMSLQQYDLALYDATMAQCIAPTWPKAFYRVAVARLALQRYEDAAVAAWEGVQQQPDNGELKELLQKCVRKGRKEHHKK